MTLSTLIRKGGLAQVATATSATLATQEAKRTGTVAPVATVAVAKPKLWARAMTGEEETAIRTWLAHIGETDSELIDEVLAQCRADWETRAYFFRRSKERPSTLVCPPRVICGTCHHFQRIDHPHIGHCTQGGPEAIAGLWDDTQRSCDRWMRRSSPEDMTLSEGSKP